MVIKQINFVAFRTLQLDPSREWGSNPSSGYNQMSMFMKDTIRETHNTSPSLLPLHMESYFQDLDAPNVDEDFIVDHPSTMTNMRYVDMSLDIFSFLLKHNTASKSDIDVVLTSLGTGHPKALQHAIQHEFLHQFLPIKLQKQFPASRYPFTGMVTTQSMTDIELGQLVVELCRHTIIHHAHVRRLVLTRLKLSAYSRNELTEVLRAVYSDLIRPAYHVLVARQNYWIKLRMRERNPVPSIYQAPATAMISFRFVMAFLSK